MLTYLTSKIALKSTRETVKQFHSSSLILEIMFYCVFFSGVMFEIIQMQYNIVIDGT
jgi:hypothetical protein